MKHILLITAFLLVTNATIAQKKEKIKGSKLVTVEIKAVPSFENLEITDNLEIVLVKGKEASVEIDADDNLHENVAINTTGKTLKLGIYKTISGAKKFILRITYTDEFKLLISKSDSKISTLTDLDLETITFKAYDNSNLFLNSRSKSFSLFLDDNAKAEVNVKGQNTILNLSKNSNLKALLVSNAIVCDIYQKAEAKIEGDCDELKLRLDNNATVNGKNLTAKSAEIMTELNSTASIQIKTNATISMSGKSEIELYGDPKVELKKFADNATLKKKPLK